MDNTNHDLIHTLSVRMDAEWHDAGYRKEIECDSCRQMYERLEELDNEALGLLKDELVRHVENGRINATSAEMARSQ